MRNPTYLPPSPPSLCLLHLLPVPLPPHPPQKNLQKNWDIPPAPIVPAVLQVPMLHSYILVSYLHTSVGTQYTSRQEKERKKSKKRNELYKK